MCFSLNVNDNMLIEEQKIMLRCVSGVTRKQGSKVKNRNEADEWNMRGSIKKVQIFRFANKWTKDALEMK